MGVTSLTQEFTTVVAPAKMFKALILDSHNLVPKLIPQSIKSIEFVEGEGGVGSIKQTNFTDGSHFNYLKHQIDALDRENFVCKYTLNEGDVLGDKLESIAYEVKFEAFGNGGCVCKMTREYLSKDGVELKEGGNQLRQGQSNSNVKGCRSPSLGTP